MSDSRATTADLRLLKEAIDVLTSNLASATAALSATTAENAAVVSSASTAAANYAVWKAFCDSLTETVTGQRALADLAVAQLESALASTASLASASDAAGYVSALALLNGLRDKCVAWYADYANLMTTISNLEDVSVVKHALLGWGAVHGNIKTFSSAYADSSGDVVGDSVIKWVASESTITYDWTTADTASGATATTLYTPASALGGARVTGASTHERNASPYYTSAGAKIGWALYLPPEVRTGPYVKYAFFAHGSPGGHRWQYRNAAGVWTTLAEVGLNTGTNFLAPSQDTATLSLAGYSNPADVATVDVTLNLLRTDYGGCLKISPCGPSYPASDVVYYTPLRCLITNADGVTVHRPIVATLTDRAPYATVPGNVVFVSATNAQYHWTGTAWATDGADNLVDVVNFSGFGIVRHQCNFS